MDPRIAKTHAAVMRAATELLVEGGPQALTMDGVVHRSGVAKSTVYRHWATRDELLADVFVECAPDLDMPDESLDGAEALRQLVRQLASGLADPHWRRLIPALVLLREQNPSLGELQHEISTHQSDLGTRLLQRCVDDGTLDPSVLDDVEVSLVMLAGPLLLAGMFNTVEISEDLADRVADQFLAAHRPRPDRVPGPVR